MQMATNVGSNHPADSDHCHPCFILDGNNIDPAYRCEECQHQLCDECFKHHRRTLATRDHTIIALQHLAASQFKVSGKRANNKDKTDTKPKVKGADTKSYASSVKQSKVSTHEISGRREQHDSSVQQNTQSRASSTQHQLESPQYEVSGRRAKYEVSGRRVTGSDSVDQDQASGSDSVDQDQTVLSSMKNMSLDAGTSNTQTTRQAGKPYTTVTLKHSLKVKRWNEINDCSVSGLVVLQDKLIVCDNLNDKLKVYDSSYRFLYKYKCKDNPWDIAMLDVNTVVVSSASGCNMSLLSVGKDSMKEISKINTEYECRGVCCYEGKIYCAVQCFRKDSEKFSEVRVYTPGGQLLHTFEQLSDGKVEYNNLLHITVNPQTGILYVTGEYKGVLVLSTSGDVIGVMSPPKLYGPHGIAVDDHGYIYWISGHSVILVAPDTHNVVEILLDKEKCEWPICVKIYGNKMFVSHWDPKSYSDKVSIYQLS